jgi:hypothetical protein
VLPEFTITVRNLPDIHVVAPHGELDVVSAEGLSNSLVELVRLDSRRRSVGPDIHGPAGSVLL